MCKVIVIKEWKSGGFVVRLLVLIPSLFCNLMQSYYMVVFYCTVFFDIFKKIELYRKRRKIGDLIGRNLEFEPRFVVAEAA